MSTCASYRRRSYCHAKRHQEQPKLLASLMMAKMSLHCLFNKVGYFAHTFFLADHTFHTNPSQTWDSLKTSQPMLSQRQLALSPTNEWNQKPINGITTFGIHWTNQRRKDGSCSSSTLLCLPLRLWVCCDAFLLSEPWRWLCRRLLYQVPWSDKYQQCVCIGNVCSGLASPGTWLLILR